MEIKREVTPYAMRRWKETEHYKHKDSRSMPSIQETLGMTSAGKLKLPNYTLTRWSQADPIKPPVQKRHSLLPSFVYECIGEDPAPGAYLQNIKRPVVSKTMPPKTPQKRRYTKPRAKEPCVQPSMRELSFYDFKYRNREKITQRAYKPYTIEISPRAKMTVYSNFPIYNSMQKKEFKITKCARKTTSVPSERPDIDQETVDELIEVPEHASTFGEMLKRAKIIVDKQVSSFADLNDISNF